MNIQLPVSRSGRLKMLLVIGLIFILGITALVKITSKPPTAGDTSAKDSSAFLLYNDQTYAPTQNKQTDELIRKDVAYFARKSLPVYDPDKHPAVVFKVSKISKGSTGATTLEGRYVLSKDKIEIRFSRAVNERIDNSITNLKTSTAMNSQLPSSSKFNQFIKKLPIYQPNYTIEYVLRDGSISVTLAEANPIDLQNAKAFVADATGVPVAELVKYPIGYTFPTNLEDSLPPETHD